MFFGIKRRALSEEELERERDTLPYLYCWGILIAIALGISSVCMYTNAGWEKKTCKIYDSSTSGNVAENGEVEWSLFSVYSVDDGGDYVDRYKQLIKVMTSTNGSYLDELVHDIYYDGSFHPCIYYTLTPHSIRLSFQDHSVAIFVLGIMSASILEILFVIIPIMLVARRHKIVFSATEYAAFDTEMAQPSAPPPPAYENV